MVVMKFGGTSVKNAAMIQRVSEIVLEQQKKGRVIVVLSAFKGVTDDLLDAASMAAAGRSTRQLYSQLYDRHRQVWQELTDTSVLPPPVEALFMELLELLHGVYLIRESTLRTQDLIMSFGERLSCRVMECYLRFKNANQSAPEFIDARDYIITDDSFGEARVIFSSTNKRLRSLAKRQKSLLIVTGFISSTKDGITTTLGRNGSDYTAALVGAALQAERIEIWTDVDGVLSADPNIVPDAFVIPRISYAEAMELSFYGANVIHPLSIVPAVEKKLPILIKNTLNPATKGTWIRSRVSSTMPMLITGLTSIRQTSLLIVEGAGLSGNFYFLPKIFNVFANNHMQPLMIAQASSEHSICFVFQEKNLPIIHSKLAREFKAELSSKRIQSISIMKNISIISIIGSYMRGSVGLAGRLFGRLGKEGVNIIAIAQGSNERNISIVVRREQEKDVLKLLHAEFFHKEKKKKS